MRFRHPSPPRLRRLLAALAPLLLVVTFLGAQPAGAATVDPNASYVLVNRNSGKALDVYNLATGDGARITQWTRNDQNQQQWRFVDGLPHTATEGSNGVKVSDALFDLQLPAGSAKSYTFADAGDYKVTCTLHPQMNMTITVQ